MIKLCFYLLRFSELSSTLLSMFIIFSFVAILEDIFLALGNYLYIIQECERISTICNDSQNWDFKEGKVSKFPFDIHFLPK